MHSCMVALQWPALEATTSTLPVAIRRWPKNRLSVSPLINRAIEIVTNLSVDDAVVAKSKLKGENISPEAAKKQGEEWAQRAGSKIDSSVCPSQLSHYQHLPLRS